MSELLAHQQALLHSISRSLDNFKKIGKNNYTAAKIRSRITSLKETWSQCGQVNAQLLQACPEEKRASVDYFNLHQFDAIEDIYQTTLDYMADCLEEIEPARTSDSGRADFSSSGYVHQRDHLSSFSLSHLPPINIPTFSGKCEEWESFRDRFKSLIIENRELSAFARMHFWSSSLTGRALESIKNIPITADNFEVAWKTLTSRFENKRRLVEVHVAALCNLPSVSRESSFELNELRDKANRAVASLRNLNRSPAEMLSDILVYSVSQKLDPATRKAWKLKGGDDPTIPTYEDLDRFLTSRARALEELTPLNVSKANRSPKITSATASPAVPISCPICKASHYLNKCHQFIKKSPSQRLEMVKQFNRCSNCLSTKHTAQSCTSKYACRTCQKRHHSMLHVDSVSSSTNSNENVISTPSTAQSAASDAPSSTAVALFSMSEIHSRTPVLLATARVEIRSPSGRTCVARALLDQGSEMTFITGRLGQILKLRRIKMPISISAVGCVDTGTCRYAAQIEIHPIGRSHPGLTTTASILNSLTNYSPAPTSLYNSWNHLADLTLADPDPMSSDSIDILIGADLYSELILDGVRKGSRGQPIAQNTILGWVLSGPMSTSPSSNRTITVQHCSSSLSLEEELRKFWEIEEVPRQTLLSPEEQQCEEHFVKTHSRCPDGRYIVRLPFKKGPPIDIGDSYDTAERLLKGLQRRFKNNLALKMEYTNFLKEYEQLGHMRKASVSAIASNMCVYIPHHPVIRDSSATTRLRVVFNASSLTTNGTSLNHHLLIGRKLQTNLAAVISRWRQFRYVGSADIAKMYRQILIDSRDIDYQRILWLDDDDIIQVFQLLTVTYGTASAPYLALRVLQQLCEDEGLDFPLAVLVLLEHIYIDDVLFGADDILLLRQIRDQVCALLRRGQFELRKWSSNTPKLLEDINVENHGLACSKTLQTDEQLKILGLSWNPSLDVFQFRVSLPDSPPTTKRSILSMIAKLFDPLGWVTPVVISAKIFMQQLWQIKRGWDEELPSDRLNQWESIQSSLAEIDGLQLDRWTRQGSDTAHCELHGFCDASTTAYAAAVYIRVTSLSGEVSSMLLIGKSKVAPIKTMSVPRLELEAAELLSKLIEFVRTSLHLSTVPYYCWSDSKVVLAWVTQHPSKWKTFVANRVSRIQSRLPSASWRHISTDENPADCASRGIRGQQLSAHHLWWHGPTWLRLPASEWPQGDPSSYETESEQNFRATVHVAKAAESWDLASRYSSWPKLIRVTAYVIRYLSRLRDRTKSRANLKTNPSALSADECRQARIFWLKRIQEEVFPLERAALLKNKSISSKSSLEPLAPFLDEDKIIRVGGRLENAPISFQTKHPVVLAAHPLAILIVRHAHLRALHGGTQLTLATLRQEFWLLRARNLVKSEIHRCVVCTRERAAAPTQLMGNLPQVRVSPPTRAFQHCGLDYAGPVLIRSMSGRGIASRKAYIAVFVCLTTRAIHLEIVDGYSTPAFLGAYSRFCARRGLPESIYSDNGTTFVGADRELTAAFRAALYDPNFQSKTASDKVSWHFIPPSAPHFGGLWEAGVRSVKHHIRRVVGAHTLTFEEFATFLCNVEACLNSRPLAPLTDTIDDYEPLTPGHFLIGSAITTSPEPSILHLKENRLSRWQLVRQLNEIFWKRWQSDYINTLQQRAKWRRIEKAGVRVGQLVLLQNSALPPCKWELGRVTHCHAGLDGSVRVVTVKTASSEYKRPIAKLCLLPIDIEPGENQD